MQKLLEGYVPHKVRTRNNYQYSLIDRSSISRKKVIKDYVFSPEYKVIGM